MYSSRVNWHDDAAAADDEIDDEPSAAGAIL